MPELILVLTPIALMDSTSIIPLCIVFLVILLGGPSPLLRSTALVAGVFVTYLACGLLVLFGLQSVLDAINAYAMKVWKDPNTQELIVQILIGFALLVAGLRIARAREQQTERKAPTEMTASQAFVSGAGMTIVGLPGAVPYLAAINLILRSDQTTRQEVITLVVYNIAFVAPLAAIVAASLVLGERSQRLLQGIRGLLDRWGQRLIVSLMLALGALLIMDGVGWFLGTPLIPV